jgi:hypothetical protein
MGVDMLVRDSDIGDVDLPSISPFIRYNGDYRWRKKAACLGLPTEYFFGTNSQKRALAVCYICPVMMECRAECDDIENRLDEEFKIVRGVWGGETPNQRKERRKHV